jgi:hypothetical protein
MRWLTASRAQTAGEYNACCSFFRCFLRTNQHRRQQVWAACRCALVDIAPSVSARFAACISRAVGAAAGARAGAITWTAGSRAMHGHADASPELRSSREQRTGGMFATSMCPSQFVRQVDLTNATVHHVHR